MEHDAKETVRQVPDSPFVLALFESFPEQANLKGGGEKLVGQPLGACPGTRRRGRKVRRKQALRRAAPCPGRVGSGEPPRTDATNAQARRRKCALAGFGPPKDVRSADDVRQRCAAAGRSAGSRSRQTAPHNPIRTGTHDAGDECGGGELNRTAAPVIGGGPHAPTALRTTTVGITDRRGDT